MMLKDGHWYRYKPFTDKYQYCKIIERGWYRGQLKYVVYWYPKCRESYEDETILLPLLEQVNLDIQRKLSLLDKVNSIQ